MESRQEPDAQPEKEDDSTDDEIIELTQAIQVADDDDIIELTTILEQPEQPEESSEDGEETIIPLVDPVDAHDEMETAQDVKDEIIELTEPAATTDDGSDRSSVETDEEDAIIELADPAADTMAEALDEDIASLETSFADEATPDLEQEQDGEEIIDLAGMETTLEDDIPETPQEPSVMASEDALPEEDEDVIDLMDVTASKAAVSETQELTDLGNQAETMLSDTADTETTAEQQSQAMTQPEEILPSSAETEAVEAFVADEAVEKTVDLPVDDADGVFSDAEQPEPPAVSISQAGTPAEVAEAIESDAMQTADASAPTEPLAATPPLVAAVADEAPEVGPVSVTEAQIDAAVERTVRSIYAEKIEQLIIETIEKTVKKEIEKIKLALMENDDGMPD